MTGASAVVCSGESFGKLTSSSRRLAIPAGFILQVRHGRNELFSPPSDPWRRHDIRRLAGTGGARGGGALWARPRRPLALGYQELHAGGGCDRVVADRDGGGLGRLFHREPAAQRGLRADSAADAAIPDRGRRAA